MKSLAYLLH